MDRLTTEQRRINMQHVRNADSRIERTLAKYLRANGIVYKNNDPKVFGKPDFTIRKLKIAVFCDSEFWHGYRWGEKRKKEFKSNAGFWIPKIEGNIKRDRTVNKKLAAAGWTVLRFWGKEILNDPNGCAMKVYRMVVRKKKTASADNPKKSRTDRIQNATPGNAPLPRK